MKIAVVGATGAVGVELLALLATSRLPITEVVAIASANSAGKQVRLGSRHLTVQPLAKDAFRDVALAFFSAGAGISREWVPVAVDAGAIVIDNSSAFRMDAHVPLVVPEVNGHVLDNLGEARIIANPNCTTAIFLTAVAPIHRAVGITKVIAATYQAVSGTGAKAMQELETQVAAYAQGHAEPLPEVYPHPIAFNVLPHVDKFLPEYEGYSKEELKLRDESRKILGAPDLKVSATCVRVPVLRSHSIAASIELGRELSPEEARELISRAPGVIVQDDPAAGVYPLPRERTGRNDCAVGRIRKDLVFDPGLSLWVVGDQLLKGAALNAVQIAEALNLRGQFSPITEAASH